MLTSNAKREESASHVSASRMQGQAKEMTAIIARIQWCTISRFNRTSDNQFVHPLLPLKGDQFICKLNLAVTSVFQAELTDPGCCFSAEEAALFVAAVVVFSQALLVQFNSVKVLILTYNGWKDVRIVPTCPFIAAPARDKIMKMTTTQHERKFLKESSFTNIGLFS
jgi:hypothetical protein